MKKITISKEGSAPLDILVDDAGNVKSVESAGQCIYSEESYEVSFEDALISTESDFANLNTVDRVFAEIARESGNPALSTESMPRMSGIKPFSFTSGRDMNRQVFIKTLDEYLKGQKPTIEKIKHYLTAKGWEDQGVAGLSKVPTCITQWFKTFGWKGAISLANARKSIIEKEVDGLKFVFVHTDNGNDSAIAKLQDFRSFKDKMVGYLILSKPGSEKFFCKQVTPIIRIDRKDNGKSRFETNISAKVSKESAIVWDEVSQEGVFADFEDGGNPSQSVEGFPRVNSLLSIMGTKMYKGVDDIAKDPKVQETCNRIKEYCAAKGWEIVKEQDSDQLKTLWTTFIGKDTSDYNRPRAKTETWKVINGVPLMFLEFDEYRTYYDSNGYPHQYHVHYICAHVYLKKPGAKRIFSKQVISKVKLRSDNERSRK